MSAEVTCPDFDFWEFVACNRCQLPLSSPSGPTVPFWLTECGHVICNNHLSPNQSCSQCGSPGIQLIPLQQDMEPPMSDWFKSASHVLDSAAYTIKFQQESMAAQIRNLQARYQQQRTYIEKLKRENTQLREILATQGQDLHHDRLQIESSSYLNHNGKRQKIDALRPPTSSSPRSVATPVGPNRITLPPGQQPPQLSSNQNAYLDENAPPHNQHLQRPGSSRFTQQFAHVPVQEQMRLPQLSHTQAAPKQLRRPLHHNSQPQNASHSQMLPPPPPAKPKPSTSSNPNMSQGLHSSIGPSQSSGRYFGPSLNTQESSRHSADSQMNSTTTNRFLPMNERFPPPSTPANLTDSRRFVSPATRGGTFRPAVFTTNTSSRAPASRAQPNPPGGSGQRMPFVPGK